MMIEKSKWFFTWSICNFVVLSIGFFAIYVDLKYFYIPLVIGGFVGMVNSLNIAALFNFKQYDRPKLIIFAWIIFLTILTAFTWAVLTYLILIISLSLGIRDANRPISFFGILFVLGFIFIPVFLGELIGFPWFED